MPKTRPDKEAEAFGARLEEILAAAGQPRRGAGAYLARRYKVATVTANAWLNGEHRAETSLARRIAEDHGSTFDYLYFGRNESEAPQSQSAQLDLGKLRTAQKFLEDVFRGEGVRFIASEQTVLLAAVYDELMTASEPNLVEMASRFGRKIRGERSERQGAAGGTLANDRDGVGEGGQSAGTKARRVG